MLSRRDARATEIAIIAFDTLEHEVGDAIAAFATATDLFRSGTISRRDGGTLWWPFYDGERDRNSCHAFFFVGTDQGIKISSAIKQDQVAIRI